MSKMSELDAAVVELRKCGETLLRISDELRGLFSADDQTQAEQTSQKENPKPLTLEDVRPILAQKSAEGHTAEVQALVKKYGATKLSQVDPANFAALLAEAEVL